VDEVFDVEIGGILRLIDWLSHRHRCSPVPHNSGLGRTSYPEWRCRARSPNCEACAETHFAQPRISTDDADLRVVGPIAGLASSGLTANTELPMFSRLKSNRSTLIAAAAALAIAAGTAAPLAAKTMSEKTVNVGGAPMYPSKNIIQNAVNSKDHTTLVAAVKTAGLVDTLSGPPPFTAFPPT